MISQIDLLCALAASGHVENAAPRNVKGWCKFWVKKAGYAPAKSRNLTFKATRYPRGNRVAVF